LLQCTAIKLLTAQKPKTLSDLFELLLPIVCPAGCRYHSKALLVSFDSDNAASSHVDVLTREVQASFKRMDGEIRGMVQPDARDDDAQVGWWLGWLQLGWQQAYAMIAALIFLLGEPVSVCRKAVGRCSGADAAAFDC
jgi:hypothetical protein